MPCEVIRNVQDPGDPGKQEKPLQYGQTELSVKSVGIRFLWWQIQQTGPGGHPIHLLFTVLEVGEEMVEKARGKENQLRRDAGGKRCGYSQTGIPQVQGTLS